MDILADTIISTEETAVLLSCSVLQVRKAVKNKEIRIDKKTSSKKRYYFSKNYILNVIQEINNYFLVSDACVLLCVTKRKFTSICKEKKIKKKRILGNSMVLKSKIYGLLAIQINKNKNSFFISLHCAEIKAKMKEIHITQKEIANRLDVSPRCVSLWLNNLRTPSEKKARELLVFLGFIEEPLQL